MAERPHRWYLRRVWLLAIRLSLVKRSMLALYQVPWLLANQSDCEGAEMKVMGLTLRRTSYPFRWLFGYQPGFALEIVNRIEYSVLNNLPPSSITAPHTSIQGP